MGIRDEIINYKYYLSFLLVVLLIGFLLKYFGVVGTAENSSEDIIEIVSVVILLLLVNLFSLVFEPIVEVAFFDNQVPNPIVLDLNDFGRQSENIWVTVTAKNKLNTCLKLAKLLFIHDSTLRNIYFQIYSEGHDLLQIDPNEIYPSISVINELPCIHMIEILNQTNRYTFKINCDARHPESLSTKINTRIFFLGRVTRRCRFLILFMKIKGEGREVLFRRN